MTQPHIFQFWDQGFKALGDPYWAKRRALERVLWTVTEVDGTNLEQVCRRKRPKAWEYMSKQLRSDWARLALVHEYGGLYLDCSVVMRRDIFKEWKLLDKEWFVLKRQSPPERPCVSGFVWARAPHNPCIRAWLEALERRIVEHVDRFEYFTVHRAFIDAGLKVPEPAVVHIPSDGAKIFLRNYRNNDETDTDLPMYFDVTQLKLTPLVCTLLTC